MATNYVQEGKVLDWTNGTGAAVASGAVVVIGALLGVALGDIAIGETGAVAIQGVFDLPKTDAAVIAQGESLTWDASAGSFNDNLATAAAGDVTGAPAVAAEAKGVTAGETIAVLLTGVPGTVA